MGKRLLEERVQRFSEHYPAPCSAHKREVGRSAGNPYPDPVSSLAETADMMRRSRAREVALQLLVQHDMNPGVGREVVAEFVRERLRSPALEPFSLGLYDGVVAHAADIDRRLAAAAENWRVARMAVV